MPLPLVRAPYSRARREFFVRAPANCTSGRASHARPSSACGTGAFDTWAGNGRLKGTTEPFWKMILILTPPARLVRCRSALAP